MSIFKKRTFSKKKATNKNKTDTVKVTTIKNCFLAIILRENKGARLRWISYATNQETFRSNNHTYFSIADGLYLAPNRLMIAIYLEGISTPLSHRNVERETVTRQIEKEGELTDVELDVIKGLKFDSKILDVLLNRGLAEEFTEMKPDKTVFVVFMLIVINMILTGIAIGVEFI